MREEEGEKGFQLGWLEEEEEEEWWSRDNLGGIEATAADGYEKKEEGRKDALAQEGAGKKRITFGDEGVTDKRASSLPLLPESTVKWIASPISYFTSSSSSPSQPDTLLPLSRSSLACTQPSIGRPGSNLVGLLLLLGSAFL